MKLLTLFLYCTIVFGHSIDRHVVQQAKAHNINPTLIMSLIQAESNYDAKAVSPAGAIGLMQLMPATVKRFGVVDPYDPVQNVTGGIRYFKQLIDHFGYAVYALAAYNAGEKAVQKYKGIPPYKETIAYVKKVEKIYRQKTGRTFAKPTSYRQLKPISE